MLTTTMGNDSCGTKRKVCTTSVVRSKTKLCRFTHASLRDRVTMCNNRLAHASPLLTIHRPMCLHCGPPFLGPSISMGPPATGPSVLIAHHASAHPSALDNHALAHPSSLLTTHRPIRLHCPSFLGPSISVGPPATGPSALNAHHASAHPSALDNHAPAHPSPLLTTHRPIRLHGTTNHRPIRLHCPSFLGPSISMGPPATSPSVLMAHHASAHPSALDNHAPAHPSPLLTGHPSALPILPGPICLHCTPCLSPPICFGQPRTGPSISFAHHSLAPPSALYNQPPAHPSPLHTMLRPTIGQPCTGPPVSFAHHSPAHPSALYNHPPAHLPPLLAIHWPICLQYIPFTGSSVSMGHPTTGPPVCMGQPSAGPSVSFAHHTPAHSSLLHSVHRPRSLGPSVSIIYSIQYQYLIHSYTTLYYIPPAHPFPSGTHYTPAHSSILLHFLSWADMGWPIPLGTLSPSAVPSDTGFCHCIMWSWIIYCLTS